MGYLAKSVMFPMGLIFLAAGLFSFGSLRRGLPRISVAVAVFILIVGPFVFAMSRLKGRMTFGDTGKLNYLWSINQVPVPHWQGDQPGNGAPKHPTRKIFDNPRIYEFGDPVVGTYPVWYDPTYWYEGSVSHFDLRKQLVVIGRAVKDYYGLFHDWGLQYGLLVGLLSLILMGRRRWSYFSYLVPYWTLIIPALAGLGLYALVNVQGRYVASFFVLLWLALFSAVRLPDTSDAPRLLRSLTIVLMAVMTFTLVASSAREAARTARYLIVGEDRAAHEQWQVAEGLRQLGMMPGDKVAVIGNPIRSFWAHLGGLRIVAELPSADSGRFWEADLTLRAEVVKTFSSTGAKAIVIETPPVGADLNGWQKIANTEYYVYLVKT